MWRARGNELSDTAPGPWVILLTITQDSPSFIAHARRLLRVCNNYLGLAVRSLVPAQRGWCSVSLHSRLGPCLSLACLLWFMVENNTTYLEGREPSTSPGAKKRLGTCQSCKFISNYIKPIAAVEAPWSDDGSVVGFKTAKTWAREFYLWSIHF